MAEEFTFQKCVADGTAIYSTKYIFFSGAFIMNYPCYIFFSGSTFTCDQYTGVFIFCCSERHFQNFFYLVALANKITLYFFLKLL